MRKLEGSYSENDILGKGQSCILASVLVQDGDLPRSNGLDMWRSFLSSSEGFLWEWYIPRRPCVTEKLKSSESRVVICFLPALRVTSIDWQRVGRSYYFQRIADDYDKKELVKACKRKLVIEHPEYGEVTQLLGDQHNICLLLGETGLGNDPLKKVHGC